jgi:hypothetical protein
LSQRFQGFTLPQQGVNPVTDAQCGVKDFPRIADDWE